MNTSYVTNSSYGNLPLIDGNIDLNAETYSITTPGIYEVTNSSFSYYLGFPDPLTLNGQRIVVTNKDYDHDSRIPALVGGNGAWYYNWDSPYPVLSEVTGIPVGITYNFISNGDKWIALPLRNENSDGDITNGYVIRRGGVYVHRVDERKPSISISIAPAAALEGETVLIIQQSPVHIQIYGGICNKDEYRYQEDPYILGAGPALLEIVSIGGVWRVLAIRS
jgi:hypothetical protein